MNHFDCDNCRNKIYKLFKNGKICVAYIKHPIRNDLIRVCFKRTCMTRTAGVCENVKDINTEEAIILKNFLNYILEHISQNSINDSKKVLKIKKTILK